MWSNIGIKVGVVKVLELSRLNCHNIHTYIRAYREETTNKLGYLL